MSIIWHYTIRAYLPQILADGLLKPAIAGVPRGERPAVWFSSNPAWEETANKMVMTWSGPRLGTKETTHRHGGGLCRIGVTASVAPHGWGAFKRLSGIKTAHARALERAGLKAGAKPAEWYVSFAAVPREKWVSVELWNGREWEPAPMEATAAAS
jgi:hypothetical protein